MTEAPNIVHVHHDDAKEVDRFFSRWVEQLIGLPETVYHYTGSSGLKGIVEHSKIYLTNIAYLNDSSEYVRSVHRVHQALEAITDLEKRDGVKFIYERIRDRLRKTAAHGYLPPPLTFVASFSMVRDDLSQWRGYGGPQAGFSLGFNSLELSKAVSRSKGYLIRCVYDDDALWNFVKNLLEHVGGVFETKHAEHQGTDEQYAESLIDLYANHLEWVVPVFKDPAFAAEREVRIIIGRGAVTVADVVIDAKPSILSGHVDLVLKDADSGLMPLASVDVGPGANAHLSFYAAQALLLKNGYSEAEAMVARSRIPFRTL